MARRKKYQHGSLIKRGKRKKVWVARWWEDVVGENGTEKIRRSEILGTVSEFPTKREAENALADRLRRVNSGDLRPQSSLSFETFAENHWLPLVKPSLKFSTKQHYEYVLKSHLYPEFGHVQLRMISRDMVQRFLLKKTQALSWKTVKHIRTVFGTAFKAAFDDGLVSDNPVLKTKLPRRGAVPEKRQIQPEEIRKVLENLPEPSRSIAGLLIFTGMRIGEALALRWCDVDLESGTIRIRQTVYEGHFDEPKTKRSNRTIPLGPKGLAILSSRVPENPNPDELIFLTRNGTPLSRRNLMNRQLTPTCEALRLKGINWHWLRHANASLLDSVGAPLSTTQALLGHSSAKITSEIYLHSVPADARNAVARVEDLIENAKPKAEDVPEIIGPNRTQVLQMAELATSLIQ
jgi:integrase